MCVMHDPGRVVLRRALRVAVVLPLAFVTVAQLLNMPAGAAYTVFGTFALLGRCDFGGPTKDRGLAFLTTGAVGLVAISLGTVAAQNRIAGVVGTFVVGSILMFAGVLRGYVAAAAPALLLPFVIAVTAGPALSELPQRLVGFAVAIVFSTVGALVLWPVHVRSILRLRVAETLSASANVMRALWPNEVGNGAAAVTAVDLNTRIRQLVEANHQLREQYDGRLLRPGGATARDRALMQIIDEISRLRLFLGWRPSFDELGLPSDVSLARVVASTLDQCAQAIGHNGEPPNAALIDDAREEHRLVTEAWATARLSDGQADKVQLVLDAGFHVRALAVEAELIARHARIAVGVRPQAGAMTWAELTLPLMSAKPGSMLRAHLTLRSPWFRNSLRAGLALAIAVAVADFSGVQHGFWVVLGTLTALQFDALGTGRTAVQAIVGTIGGFVVGTILVAVLLLISNDTVILWVLLPILTFLAAYTSGAISLLVGQGAFTVFVIGFYALLAGPNFQTGELRVLDVSIGLTISLVVSALMWPRGVVARVRSTLVTAMYDATAYLVVAYDRLLQGDALDGAVDLAARKASVSLQNANETFDLTMSQGGPRTVYAETWSCVANAAGQTMTASRLVAFIGRSGRAPVGCPGAADSLIACAHAVQAQLNAAVERLGTLAAPQAMSAADEARFSAPDVSAMGDPFPRLRACVNGCLHRWQTVAPTETEHLGGSALSLIWAQDWLLHLTWMAGRTAQVCATGVTNPELATEDVPTAN